MSTNEPPQLYTIEEAAARLKVGKSTLRRWIRTGKVRAVRVGKALRLRADDLVSLLKDVGGAVGTVLQPTGPFWQTFGMISAEPDLAENHDRYLAEIYENENRKT